MSMEKARVQILIPVYNNVDEIDKTIQSIWNQNFDKDNIYVVMVDFGSTDGSYEKILEYPSNRLGVYQVKGDFCQSTMASRTIQIADYTCPGGQFFYRMILWPGDIIYSDYLEKTVGVMIENLNINPKMVICETDIYGINGKYFYPSIYDEKCIVDGEKEYIKLNGDFYKHNMFCMAGDFGYAKHRLNGMMNERIWLNKIAMSAYERNIVYIPERLSCIKERFYDDELREILLRWEAIIVFKRMHESKYTKILDEDFLKIPEKNLAEYALWRAYICATKNNLEMARKCFMMSEVIYPEIRKLRKFELTNQLLDGIESKELEDIYLRDVINC